MSSTPTTTHSLALALATAEVREMEGMRVALCRDVARELGWQPRGGASNAGYLLRREGLHVLPGIRDKRPAAAVLDLAARKLLEREGVPAPGGWDTPDVYAQIGREWGRPAYCRATHLERCRDLARRAAARSGLDRDVTGPLDELLEACAWSPEPAAHGISMQLLEGLHALAEGHAGHLLRRPRPGQDQAEDVQPDQDPPRLATIHHLQPTTPLRLVSKAVGEEG